MATSTGRPSLNKFHFCIFILILLIHQGHILAQEDGEIPRIGIVGGGIGGTAAAYYLRQLFGDQLQIDVFEGEKVGGRLALISIDGQEYEAGGAVIHRQNQYMVNFTKMFGLGMNEFGKESKETLALYGQDGITFQTSCWSIVTIAKMLWRYGWDIKRMQDWVADMLTSFSKIYEYQAQGMSFTTVEDLLKAMDERFVNYTHYTVKTILHDAGFSDLFINELVMAALRTNYGQTPDVHGYVGAVSMAGVEPGLWSVKGGNSQVPEKLLKASKASLIRGKVTQVTFFRSDTGSVSYELQYERLSEQIKDGEDLIGIRDYDLIIMATPLKAGSKFQVKFEDFPSTFHVPEQPFHSLEAMFVHGHPNLSFFGIRNMEDFPNHIMTTDEKVFFNSIGKVSPVTQKDHLAGKPDDVENYAVWKVFLNKVPSELQLRDLFDSRKDLRLVKWLAYPAYNPTKELPSFVLHDRLYFVNAIESAASAIEMSLVGARNVALLAYNQWHSHFDKIDELGFKDEKRELRGGEL